MTLEQEVASIIKFVLDNSGNPTPYYHDMPQSFVTPAAYFPAPELDSSGDTFLTYALDYTLYILFFDKSKEAAYRMALQALTAIRGARNLIPLIAETGEETEQGCRIKDPKAKPIDDGAAQLQVSWTSRRPYDSTLADVTPMQSYEIENWRGSGPYLSKMIDTATEAEISQYLTEPPYTKVE